MKTKLTLFLVTILLAFASKSQNLIARHNAGVVTFYTTLASAYSACINDDTLYLPGGAFEAPSQFIKKLHIIGAGAQIDSSVVTGNTKIFTNSTEIKINTGASFSSFEGIYFDDLITIGSSTALDNDLHDIVFINCFFYNNELKFGVVNPTPVSNITLINCRVHTLTGQKAENCAFYNSIFIGGVYSTKNSVFKNCVLQNTQLYNEYTTYENCFNSGSVGFYDTYCNYINCICEVGTYGATNNFINPLSCFPVFIDLGLDYHLLPTCEGVNGGTDGTDVGIYGGTFVWKDGMIPSNPHISSKSIPDASNGDGTLDVNIKVNAQDL